MKDKGDVFMWACFLISLAFLQAGALFDSRLIKKLESRCKANEESIAILYGSMQTNKVAVESFMMHYNKSIEMIDAEKKWHVYYFHTKKEDTTADDLLIKSITQGCFTGVTNGLRFVNGFLVEKLGGGQ